MARRIIGNQLDRENRNNLNSNFEELYDDVGDIAGRITDDVYMQIRKDVNLNWQEPVETASELPTEAYSGDTRMTRDTGTVYRYSGDEWVEIQQLNPDAIHEIEDRLQAEMDTKETPAGAQEKADAAEINANQFTSDLVSGDNSSVVRVVEQGENSNGSYIRYSSGVQECWLEPVSLATSESTGNIYRSERYDAYFPVDFVPGTIQAVASVRSIGKWANCNMSNYSDRVLVYQYGSVQSTSTFNTDIYVVGRWK